MKQLFVDILTKMTPNFIGPTEIQYSIKNGDKTIYIDIDWRYVNPNNVPKLEFTLPHSSSFLLFLLIFELNDKIPEHKNITQSIIFS